MTVAVMSGQRDDNSAQVLAAALGVARDLYKVNMDEKATLAANALAEKKLAQNLSEDEAKAGRDFLEKNEIVAPTARGAINPNQVGLQLPKGLKIPDGMAVRPRS